MWAGAGIVLSVILIVLTEVPYLLRKRLLPELAVFLVLLLAGTVLSFMEVMRVKLPNPLDWITAVYKPISDAFNAMMK
ncbi:hypothetical protein ACFQ88_23870 [Paenibacillus sp. NPDC056579]|uniref:hypothetical protein n=1 Tax=Paenibacillus sp. NPDC056579 TaxID=3345871 RepID=UPI0036B60975